MDFYQQQSQARRQSRVLITIYLVGMLALGLVSSRSDTTICPEAARMKLTIS